MKKVLMLICFLLACLTGYSQKENFRLYVDYKSGGDLSVMRDSQYVYFSDVGGYYKKNYSKCDRVYNSYMDNHDASYYLNKYSMQENNRNMSYIGSFLCFAASFLVNEKNLSPVLNGLGVVLCVNGLGISLAMPHTMRKASIKMANIRN